MPLKFATKIYRHDLTLQEAKDNQQDLEILINKLNNNYNPKNQTKIKGKDDTSAKKLFFMREEIISAFKKGIFPYIDGFQVEKETDEDRDEETDKEIETTIMPELESEEFAAEKKEEINKEKE